MSSIASRRAAVCGGALVIAIGAGALVVPAAEAATSASNPVGSVLSGAPLAGAGNAIGTVGSTLEPATSVAPAPAGTVVSDLVPVVAGALGSGSTAGTGTGASDPTSTAAPAPTNVDGVTAPITPTVGSGSGSGVEVSAGTGGIVVTLPGSGAPSGSGSGSGSGMSSGSGVGSASGSTSGSSSSSSGGGIAIGIGSNGAGGPLVGVGLGGSQGSTQGGGTTSSTGATGTSGKDGTSGTSAGSKGTNGANGSGGDQSDSGIGGAPVGRLLGFAVRRSLKTVYPVADGYRDRVVFGLDGLTSSGTPQTIHGIAVLRRGSNVVKRWSVTRSDQALTWSGTVGSKIVPGVYRLKVGARDAAGHPFFSSTSVKVSAKRLVATTAKYSALAVSGNHAMVAAPRAGLDRGRVTVRVTTIASKVKGEQKLIFERNGKRIVVPITRGTRTTKAITVPASFTRYTIRHTWKKGQVKLKAIRYVYSYQSLR